MFIRQLSDPGLGWILPLEVRIAHLSAENNSIETVREKYFLGERVVNGSRNQVHNATPRTTKEVSNYVQIQIISLSSIPKTKFEVFLDFWSRVL